MSGTCIRHCMDTRQCDKNIFLSESTMKLTIECLVEVYARNCQIHVLDIV